ncbi:carboxylic ester hydrolase [Spirosoma migulaei]
MNSLDILILVLLVLTTVYTIVASNRANGVLPLSISLLALLVVIQFFWKGFYWQYIPTYWLICLLILIVYVNSALYRKLQHISLGVFLVVALMPWSIFLPVPTLPEPLGKYAVGTQVFRWVDSSRTEQITEDPFDKRNVIVQAWYPAQGDGKGSHSLYLDGLPHLPPKVSVLPSFLLDHYDQIDIYAVGNATPLNAPRKWPVVLFLPGYGAARAFYTSLVVGLASHGYVVLSMDHPYEAAITQLANGKLATTIENFQPDAPDRLGFMKNRLDIRVADVQFVLNQLENKKSSATTFFPSLDLNRIGIAGHSLGGATGGDAMAHDSRIKAAVNIDGTLYGGLPKSRGSRPFLLIESNKGEPGRFARYEAGNQLLFKQVGGGYRYELEDADHYSFTDVPLLLAPPARFLAGHLFSLGQVSTKTHMATISLLDAFFDHTLRGNPSQLEAVANRYAGILRKQVAP